MAKPLLIKARNIAGNEELLLEKSEFWGQLKEMRPLAIIGRADHPYIEFLNEPSELRKVWLGDGQYIYDGPPAKRAPQGKTIEIEWSSSTAYVYATNIAQELGIRFFQESSYPYDKTPLYCGVSDSIRFLDAISAADRGLKDWYENRFFLIRWLGPMCPEWKSLESKVIQQSVRSAFK